LGCLLGQRPGSFGRRRRVWKIAKPCCTSHHTTSSSIRQDGTSPPSGKRVIQSLPLQVISRMRDQQRCAVLCRRNGPRPDARASIGLCRSGPSCCRGRLSGCKPPLPAGYGSPAGIGKRACFRGKVTTLAYSTRRWTELSEPLSRPLWSAIWSRPRIGLGGWSGPR
jgi:hypothetical protein